MSLWFRTETDRWERIMLSQRVLIEQARAAGVDAELDRDMAIEDLHHWQVRSIAAGRRMTPSRTELAERWPGWTDKRIRLLLADEDAWADPHLADKWEALKAKGPTKGQRRANEGPTKGQKPNGQTPTTEEKGPDEGQTRANEGPTKGHTREVVRERNETEPPAGETARATPLQPSVAVGPPPEAQVPTGEAEQAIAEATALDLQREPALGINHKLKPADQRAIREAIRGGHTASDVRLVGEWVANSGHSEAIFLRENHHRWRTVVNDRFGPRLKLAQAWSERGRPSTEAATGPPTRASPRPTVMDKLRDLDAKWAADEAARSRTDDDSTLLIEVQHGDQPRDAPSVRDPATMRAASA